MKIKVIFITDYGFYEKEMDIIEYIKIVKIRNWLRKNNWFKGTNTTDISLVEE